MPAEGDREFDVVLAGGGLASVLIALALLERRPSLRLALVERESTLGGNHTWCFHAADVPERARSLIEPLIVKQWPSYSVRFPGRVRSVRSSYACIDSARLHDVARRRFTEAPHCTLVLDTAIRWVGRDHVMLDDGRRLHGALVIDARGPLPPQSSRRGATGYQKFVGVELEVEPHGLVEPILFDACLPQRDGFRFMYVLPLAQNRVLVEETFFADGPTLDLERGKRATLDYARALGLSLRRVVRTEQGVLPMPWHEDVVFDPNARPLEAGYRAGLFHPVTGYSLPMAIRFALALADRDATQNHALTDFAREHAAQRPFLLFLTRLMFTAFAPAQRFSVLEHFYRLPEPIIERFYAGELTALDRGRVFFGLPPRGFSALRALGLVAGGEA